MKAQIKGIFEFLVLLNLLMMVAILIYLLTMIIDCASLFTQSVDGLWHVLTCSCFGDALRGSSILDFQWQSTDRGTLNSLNGPAGANATAIMYCDIVAWA